MTRTMALMLGSSALVSAALFAPARPGTPAKQEKPVNTIPAASDDAGGVVALAHELDKSEKFKSEMTLLLDATVTVKQGPLQMLWILQETYGDDLPGFAEPGTDEKDKDSLGLNRPYEKYTIKVTEGGETKRKPVNWYTRLWVSTGMGGEYADYQAQLDEALSKAPDMSKVTHAAIKENANNKRWLVSEKKRISQRMTDGRKFIRSAAEIAFAEDRILSIPGVGVEYDTYKDKDGNLHLSRTQYPFIVYDTERRGFEKHLSTSQFINLGKRDNIAKVKEAQGGNWDVLVDTLKREGQSGQGGGKELPLIETVDTFHDYLNRVSTFIDFESEDGRKHHAAILKALSAKDSDELVMAIGTSFQNMDSLYGKIQDRYERLIAAKAMAAGKQAAA